MSHNVKIVLAIVVVLVLIGGGYWWYTRDHATSEPTTQTSMSDGSADVQTLPSGSATSDQAIGQDLSAIDTQIDAAGKDTASAGASVDAAQ